MKKFCGVMPALLTPLTENEDLNVPALELLLDRLLAEGADGFYIGGATGECLNLRREVREALAYEAVRRVDHRVPCIVHIATPVFSDAVALAKQAEACGADAVSAIPPIFFSYDEDDVFQYYKKLAESVSIPLIVYFNPNAGVRINARFAARTFEIDNVTGIKWTSSDYFGMNLLRQLTHGEMNIINGPDEMLLMGLSAGADGGIGSTYNVMLPRFKRIYEGFRSGNTADAMEAQCQVNKVIDVLLANKVVPSLKIILEKEGIPAGCASFPHKRYGEAQKEEIWQALLAAGLRA